MSIVIRYSLLTQLIFDNPTLKKLVVLLNSNIFIGIQAVVLSVIILDSAKIQVIILDKAIEFKNARKKYLFSLKKIYLASF